MHPVILSSPEGKILGLTRLFNHGMTTLLGEGKL